MRNTIEKIAVTSKSFSNNVQLRQEIEERYAHVIFNDHGLKLEGSELVYFLKDRTKAIIGLEKFDGTILSQLPNLNTLSRFGVGLDGVDFDTLKKYRVKLSVTPGINRLAVAELTLSYMMMLLRKSHAMACQLKNGIWKKETGFELSGKTIGIIGVNHIGKEVIRLLKPFFCTILIFDMLNLEDYCKKHGVFQVGFDKLIREADIVSLHVPSTPKTKHMINADVLTSMKKTAFIINTARGNIIDQSALKNALIKNKIAGAALDVFENEPCEDRELLSLENVIATPHIAGNSTESELMMGRVAIAGLENAEIPV